MTSYNPDRQWVGHICMEPDIKNVSNYIVIAVI